MKINAKNLIYFQIIFSLWLNFLTTSMRLPNVFAYLGDGINVLILILMRYSFIKKIKSFRGEAFGIIGIFMLLVLVTGIVGNMVNPLYIIWGIRNNFRYFLFWLLCIAAFYEEDEDRLFRILDVLFNVNVVFVLVQHFAMGLEQDYLGGIFGIHGGGNARMNVFLCVVLSYHAAMYMNGRKNTLKTIWVLLASMGIATYAEMKFFYFEAIVIVMATVAFSKPSKKTFSILVGTFLALAIGLYLLWKFDPLSFSIISDIEKLVMYGNMESGGYNISRFKAFSTIERLFFGDSLFYRMFGFGIGNTDTSAVEVFNSVFYRKYGFLHYTWFSHQQWFLETGYLGFGLVVLFFLTYIAYVFKYAWKTDKRALSVFSIVFSLILIINLWYNNALRLECAYLSFACLAFLPCKIRQADNRMQAF